MDFTPPDGSQLVFVERSESSDIFVLDVAQKTSTPLFTTEAAEAAASLSADGQWLAYDYDRTGGREAYVRQFADGDEIPVSTSSGRHPMWSTDGLELFYQSSLTRMFAAPLRADSQAFGLEPLFASAPFWLGINGASYDIATDGRFLMIRHRDPTDPPDRLEVILNFSERLNRLAPPGGSQ